MQRPRPEGKDSAARSRSDYATPHVDVIVLTVDPALLATLREASGPAHKLFHAESAEAAVDLLVGGHCGLFIVDVALVRRNVVELIDKLQTQFPEVLVLATGRREEQQAVAGLVGSGRIYRFLHKPISPARAELFLSAATRRYGELHPHDARSGLALGALATPRNRTFLLSAATLLVVLGIALGWWSTQRTEERTEPSIASTRQATPSLDDVLARADSARSLGRLLPPTPGNALEQYREALRIEPNNEHALREIERIVAKLEQETTAALAARDAPKARIAFTTLQQASPDHPRLDELQAALLALAREAPARRPNPAATPAPATPRAVQPPPAQVTATPSTSNVELARAFLDANQFFEPLDASALGSLRRAQSAGENADAIKIVATDLGMRLLNRAETALEGRDVAGAKANYERAREIDREFETALPQLEQVATRISAAEGATHRAALESSLQRAIQLRQSGQLIEPQGNNAVEALQAVLAVDPNSAAAKNEQQRLSLALLENTRTALAAGEIDRADVLATRAEQVLPGLPQTKVLREQIGAARAQREEASTVLQAASMPRTRQVPAIYPRDALLNAIEGWVDLEFTISPEGVPSDITVKASEPRRVFDVAAVQALRQWRFEPIVRDGPPRARRAKLRMEFKLKG